MMGTVMMNNWIFGEPYFQTNPYDPICGFKNTCEIKTYDIYIYIPHIINIIIIVITIIIICLELLKLLSLRLKGHTLSLRNVTAAQDWQSH